MSELPEFTGKPIIKNPKLLPQTDFLKGKFGKEVLQEYEKRTKTDYKNNTSLKVLSYDQEQDIVTGSNPFATVLVNDIVTSRNVHVASPAELEKILQADALPLRGTYEDTALVLRDEEEPNSYLAKDLMRQLRSRGKVETPVMIPLKDLTLKHDAQSPYGLAFLLKESAQPVHAPILNKKSGSMFTSEDVDEKTGLPKKVGSGTRCLWTRRSGLSRLYMDSGLGLYAFNDNLNNSNDAGRVSIVSAGGAEKNFEEQLLQEYKKRQELLAEKYKKALQTFNE